jgi:hypothetical protein
LEIDGTTDVWAGTVASFTAFSSETASCKPLYQFYVGSQWQTASYNPNFDYVFNKPGTYRVGVNAQCRCTNCAMPGCNDDDPWDWPVTSPINSALPGTSADHSMLVYVYDNCEVDFELSGTGDYRISTTPTMPTITATVTHKFPADATITWSAKISHTAPNGGYCSGGPDFSSNEVSGAGDSFTPSFGGFYGGDLKVKATCTAPGYLSAAKADSTRKVIGTEPTDTTKGTYLSGLGSPFDSADLRRIACHESGLSHFKNSGQPLYSSNGAGDVGLMQVCFQRTHDRVWSWHSNVDFGRTILTNDARNGARNWLNEKVTDDNATPYTTAMWRREGIHRYNAGCCL